MLYCQLDYPQELGTKDPNGETITIAQAGCALTCIASMLTNVFGDNINPEQLNQELIGLGNGYGSNGAGDYDLINWGAVPNIYADGELNFNFNHTYYNDPNTGEGQPANMQEIDDLLAQELSVIVGVSFNHNPKEPTPTHYVEIYRKNNDGTYQMRDPMFRDSECDTVFDKRYAVNGMSVANAILQVVSYTGPIPDQTKPEPSPALPKPANAKYNIGDTTQVYSKVPTGKEPSAISFSYGSVEPKAQAKIIGYDQYSGDWFYNVDQTAIGGGTGYARVEDIDKASVPPPVPSANPASTQTDKTTSTQTTPDATPANTPANENQAPSGASGDVASTQNSAQITPEEQITQLQTEKGDLANKLEEANKKYSEDLSNYQALVAAGYDTVDTVVSKIEGVGKANVGLKKQLVQVLKRNQTLNSLLSERDKEDATAIDEGIKFEELYKELHTDMTIIAKIFKTKPTINDILSAADKIKSAYDKVIVQLKKRDIKNAVQTAVSTAESMNIDPAKETSIGFLNKLLSFSWLKMK